MCIGSDRDARRLFICVGSVSFALASETSFIVSAYIDLRLYSLGNALALLDIVECLCFDKFDNGPQAYS